MNWEAVDAVMRWVVNIALVVGLVAVVWMARLIWAYRQAGETRGRWFWFGWCLLSAGLCLGFLLNGGMP